MARSLPTATRRAARPRARTSVLPDVWKRMARHHTTLVAAGVAFYAMLAVFPGIAALISIWALAFTPETLLAQINGLAQALPSDAAGILLGQARAVALGRDAGVGLAALFGIAVALWSASRGVMALMEGVNIAYGTAGDRGFLKTNVVALGLTLALLVGMIIAFALVAVLPAILARIPLGPWGFLWSLLPWPMLFLAGMVLVSMVYRYAPARGEGRRGWFSPGASSAMTLWVACSIGFSVYVANFGAYNATYGAIGGVIVLLLWLWLSALCVLVGAEIDAACEA